MKRMNRSKKCFTALLMACLMLVTTLAAAGTAQAYIWPDRDLVYGLTGEDVLSLQTALRDQGYEVGALDGIFGAYTENALIAYQTDHDLYVDGIAGPLTLTSLYGAQGNTQQRSSAGSSDTGTLSRSLSIGMTGADVSTLQTILKEYGFYSGIVDGDFGNYTRDAVMAFQTSQGLYVDGVAGPLTFAALSGALSEAQSGSNTASSAGSGLSRRLAKGMTGSDVKDLQNILKSLGYYSGAIDGDFGAVTEAAVIAFQQAKGLYVDGIAGPITLEALRAASPAAAPAQQQTSAAAAPAASTTPAQPAAASAAADNAGTPAAAGPVLTAVCNAPGGLRIDWEKTAGAASYRVLRLAADGSWQAVADTNGLYFIDKNVVPGNRYTYTVRALAADGSYAGDYNQTGLSFTYTYDYDNLLASAPASVSKEDLMSMGKKLGMDSYEIKALIGWVEGEGYTNIGDPYMAYLSACVVLNGILDGIYGRGRDLVDRIETWGSYYSPNAQEQRYENASASTLLAVYLAMQKRPAGIYFCRGAYSKPANCFYDAGFDVQGQHVYVW